jgi:hypothetical protein
VHDLSLMLPLLRQGREFHLQEAHVQAWSASAALIPGSWLSSGGLLWAKSTHAAGQDNVRRVVLVQKVFSAVANLGVNRSYPLKFFRPFRDGQCRLAVCSGKKP